jgi:hypothetical protein
MVGWRGLLPVELFCSKRVFGVLNEKPGNLGHRLRGRMFGGGRVHRVHGIKSGATRREGKVHSIATYPPMVFVATKAATAASDIHTRTPTIDSKQTRN